MQYVKPKKYLGQHFLKDENIARKIVGSLSGNGYSKVLEVGPGMGVLTKYLLQNSKYKTFVCEIDPEAIVFLKHKFPQLKGRIIEGDFLKLSSPTTLASSKAKGRKSISVDSFRLTQQKPTEAQRSKTPHYQMRGQERRISLPFGEGQGGAIIGNFPYNISSQILFKVLEHRDQIMEVVGMFQKEVAQRISSPPGNKTYGILSVLMQAYYKTESLFTVNENAFHPPPKVKSTMMRFIRNDVKSLNCNEALFFKVVKTGFNQRRKTLRNALKTLFPASGNSRHQLLDKRAEQLSVEQFVELTNLIEGS